VERGGIGFLGMQFAPFVVNNPNQMPNNAELPSGVNGQRFNRRLDLMKDLEDDLPRRGAGAGGRPSGASTPARPQLVLSPG